MIYPPELEIKETTESSSSAPYLDILLKRESKGNLSTRLYDKKDDFDFTIINFPIFVVIYGETDVRRRTHEITPGFNVREIFIDHH